MKQVTIKAVTVFKDFSQEDRDFINRMITVLQTHNLSVMVTYSKDRHKKKLPDIKLRNVDIA